MRNQKLPTRITWPIRPSCTYTDVDQHPKFTDIERSIIEAWEARQEHSSVRFRTTVGRRRVRVIRLSPPFANGRPHSGHLLTGCGRTAVLPALYRRCAAAGQSAGFGMGRHGLPIEMQSREGDRRRPPRRSRSTDRRTRFTQRTASSSSETTDDVWRDYVSRSASGRHGHDYRTWTSTYMESVHVGAGKNSLDKGVTRYRVLPYCWECETPVSPTARSEWTTLPRPSRPAVKVWFELATASGCCGNTDAGTRTVDLSDGRQVTK